MNERLSCTELLRQLNSARTPLHSFLSLICEHVQLRTVAISHGQLRTRRLLLQSSDRLFAIAFCLCSATQKPTNTGQPSEVIALTNPVLQLLPNLESFLTSFKRLLVLPRKKAFIRAALPQLCAFAGF